MVASKYAFVSVDTRGKSYVPDAMIAAVSYLNGTPSVSGSLQTGQYLESTQSEVPLGLKVTSSSHAWLLSAGGAPGGVGDIYVRDITIGSNSVSASSRSFVAAYPHATGGSQIHSSGKMMVSHAFQPFGVDGYISCLDLASATSGTPVNMQSLGAIVNPIWNPYMVMMTDSLAFILPNGRYSGGISGGGSACGRSMHTLALSGTTISSVSPVPTDSGSFGSNLHDTLINWNAYRTDVVAAYHIDSTRVFVFYFGKVGEDLYSTPMAGVVCELRARVVTVSGHGSMSLGPELVVCAAAEDWSYHDGIYGTPWHDHHFHFPDGRFDGLPSINLDGTFSFVTAATISGLRTFYRFTVSVSGTSCSVASIERVDSGRSWGPYKMAE